METWFLTYGGFWGSVTGGIIGGILTYFGVLLTINSQKKNEYPQKLVTLTNMLSEVESLQNNLNKLLQRKTVPKVYYSATPINIKDIERSLMLQAVMVDKHTYVYVSKVFSLYRKKDYPQDIKLANEKSKDNKYGFFLLKCINELQQNIDHQIKRYTKKI